MHLYRKYLAAWWQLLFNCRAFIGMQARNSFSQAVKKQQQSVFPRNYFETLMIKIRRTCTKYTVERKMLISSTKNDEPPFFITRSNNFRKARLSGAAVVGSDVELGLSIPSSRMWAFVLEEKLMPGWIDGTERCPIEVGKPGSQKLEAPSKARFSIFKPE